MATLDSKISVSEDTLKIFIDDSPSTWGSPNRVDSALLCYVRYMGSSEEEIVLSEVSYDNTFTNSTVTEFEIEYVKDGWYKVLLVIIPLNPAEAEGAIRFNESTGNIEIFTDDEWVVLTDYDIFYDSELYNNSERDIMLYSKNAKKTNCVWLTIANNTCKDLKCTKDKFWFMRGQLYSLLNQFAIGNKFEAQKMIENVTEIANSI